jgi:hypothetical protein
VGSTTLVCKLDASRVSVPVGFWTHCFAGVQLQPVCDALPAGIVSCDVSLPPSGVSMRVADPRQARDASGLTRR